MLYITVVLTSLEFHINGITQSSVFDFFYFSIMFLMTLDLFPVLGYYGWSFNQYSYTMILGTWMCFHFLGSLEWNFWVIWWLYLLAHKNLQNCQSGYTILCVHMQCVKLLLFPHLTSTLYCNFYFSHYIVTAEHLLWFNFIFLW